MPKLFWFEQATLQVARRPRWGQKAPLGFLHRRRRHGFPRAHQKMQHYGATKEQAAAILFLASDEASYSAGVTLPVAGGDLG